MASTVSHETPGWDRHHTVPPKGPDTVLNTSLTALLIAASAFSALAAVYLLSTDPSRRRRAWQLLRLLLRR